MQIILQIPTDSIKAIARTLTADTLDYLPLDQDKLTRDKVLRAIITQAYFPNCFRDPELSACIEADRRAFARALRSRRLPKSRHAAPR